MSRSLLEGVEALPIRRSPNGVRHTRPQPGRDHPEWVVAINRNDWSQSIGISGRNQPVRALVVLVGQKKAVAIAVRTVSGRRRW